MSLEDEEPMDELQLPETRSSERLSQSSSSFFSTPPNSTFVSPSKRLELASQPPESPDMKFARDRLGNLLSSIRKGEIQPNLPKNKTSTSRDQDEEVRRGPGRPRKPRKDRRVVFELRGKPFGLRDKSSPDGVYSLARSWMRSKDDDAEKDKPSTPTYPPPSDDSLDLLATKEIYALPRPRELLPLNAPIAPNPLVFRPSQREKIGSEQEILNTYLSHWKAIKKSWGDFNRSRELRYFRSIHLLETVYSIAQQL